MKISIKKFLIAALICWLTFPIIDAMGPWEKMVLVVIVFALAMSYFLKIDEIE